VFRDYCVAFMQPNRIKVPLGKLLDDPLGTVIL